MLRCANCCAATCCNAQIAAPPHRGGGVFSVSIPPSRVPGGAGRGAHSDQRSLCFAGKFFRTQKFFAKNQLRGIETDPGRALLWCASCTGCTGRTGLNPLTYSLFFFLCKKRKGVSAHRPVPPVQPVQQTGNFCRRPWNESANCDQPGKPAIFAGCIRFQ